MSAADFPNDDRRLLYNSDAGNAIARRISGKKNIEEIKTALAGTFDEMAGAGVDTFSVVTSVRFYSWIGPSAVLEVKTGWNDGFDKAIEAGVDLRKVMAGMCHERGMEFMPCIRMNDRHGGPVGKIIRDHPEWQLKELSGGPGVDFAQDPVREQLLAYIEELLGAVEVDGVEFDYMRWAHMFRPGQGASHAHLLTDFTRKTRKLLDEAARRRGVKRLILGVRIPQTFEECEQLGYDVAAWIKEGLVDFVVPSDFFFIDLNTKVAEFVKLTEGTNCKVYPAVHPGIGVGYEAHYHNVTTYRAAAHSFYAGGASGVQAYNYQYHWLPAYDPGRKYLWPAALGFLTELKNPVDIARHDRHYLFNPLWPGGCQTGFRHDDRIRLSRSDPRGSQRFRLYENLQDPKLSALMQLKAVGLGEDGAIRIRINGEPVDDRLIVTKRVNKGQDSIKGKKQPAFVRHTIQLNSPADPVAIIRGDNELTVELEPGEGNGDGAVTIDDLEIYVYVRRGR